MSKKKQRQLVTVTLNGLDIELKDVEIKNIGRGKGDMFVHLEERNERWTIIHTDSPVQNEMGDELTIEFKRGGDFLFLEAINPSGQGYGFAISKAAKIVSAGAPKFLHIDQLPDGFEYRMNWSGNFFDESRCIQSIVIKKQ
ncbi:hypothetical protein RVBP21_1150 [Pseudomonas phage BRkr]|nr:hypothetical protein RVBP21_1150 [Pseudomonas phage BRkr]